MEALEIYVVVDSDGNYSCGVNASLARENYGNDVQAIEEADGFRMVCVKLQVALPAEVTVEGTVSHDDAAELTEAK